MAYVEGEVTSHNPTLHIDVATRGDVSEFDTAYARRKVAAALASTREPVLGVRIVLEFKVNPALACPALAKASADVNGHPIRAHVAAPTVREAVDLVERRLRRAADLLGDRIEGSYHDPVDVARPDGRAARPGYMTRPASERVIVRRKNYDADAIVVEEAVVEMLVRDYDFFLFTDADSGADAIVYRTDDGVLRFASVAPPEKGGGGDVARDGQAPELTDGAARRRLDATGEPFCFYRVAGRGRVLYMRFDGDYGVIEAG